jgi:hypothetical protein
MKNKHIVFLCCLAFITGCEEPKKEPVKEEPATVEKTDVMKTTTDMMVSNVDSAWNAMIKQDDDKFASVKRLLDEISFCKKYDMSAQDALLKEIPIVKAKRFNQENIKTTAVEDYDNATDEYVKKVFNLADKTKELDAHPIAAELKDDIMTANSADVVASVRNTYNKAVSAYNEHLEQNKEAISKMGPPYNSLSPKLTF